MIEIVSNTLNFLISIAVYYCVIVIAFYAVMPSCIADKVPTSILSLFRKK